MTTGYEILADLTFLNAYSNERFAPLIKIVNETDYARKWWGELPFPNATTTMGRRYVRLVWNFYTNNDRIYRTSLLIHEATHEQQVDRYGGYGNFLLNYLTGKKTELENEAYKNQREWLARFGRTL